jgi:hypothetical protein
VIMQRWISAAISRVLMFSQSHFKILALTDVKMIGPWPSHRVPYNMEIYRWAAVTQVSRDRNEPI